MRRVSLILAMAIAGAAVLAGGATGSAGSRRDAVVVGAIHYQGGPPPFGGGPHARPDAQPGRVTLYDRHRDVVGRQKVEQGQHYRFYVVPGRYRVVAKSGSAICQPTFLRARRDRTVTANVRCNVK